MDPHTGVDGACNRAGLLGSEKSRDITQPYPRGSGRPRPNWKELPGIAKGMEVREREREKGREREGKRKGSGKGGQMDRQTYRHY